MNKLQLVQFQSLPLEAKIIKAEQVIQDWYNEWEGKVYISFSGGLDSTVLRHLVLSLYPEIECVFVDTGLEYPENRQLAKELGCTFIRPKFYFKEVIEKYGYPVVSKEQAQYIHEVRNAKVFGKTYKTRLYGNEKGRGKISEKWKFLLNAPFKISHECCNKIKKEPIKRYEKESGRVAYLGTRIEESSLRKQSWLAYGCNAHDLKRPSSRPLSYWSGQDIKDYIAQNQLQYSKLYDMGYVRSGCMFCMFGVQEDDLRFRLMEKTHPKQYQYCMDTLGCRDVIEYLKKGREEKE